LQDLKPYDQTGPDGEEINTRIFNGKVEESEWKNLQDWSTCTLACGGGTKTLHRVCIKGTKGEACKGPEVITA